MRKGTQERWSWTGLLCAVTHSAHCPTPRDADHVSWHTSAAPSSCARQEPWAVNYSCTQYNQKGPTGVQDYSNKHWKETKEHITQYLERLILLQRQIVKESPIQWGPMKPQSNNIFLKYPQWLGLRLVKLEPGNSVWDSQIHTRNMITWAITTNLQRVHEQEVRIGVA